MARKKMYKRPDGLFESIRVINGKRVAFRGKTQREVERKMLEYKEDVDRGPVFKTVADAWLPIALDGISPNSAHGYEVGCRRAIDAFGDRRIMEITSLEIKAYFAELATKGFAKKTVANHRIVLNQIFKYAQTEYNFAYNPVDIVSVPKGLPQKKRQALDDETVARMLANAAKPFGLFAVMALYTGLRRGELLALQYKDIDRKTKEIKVYKSVYYEGNNPRIKSPKIEAGIRDVPMLEIVERLIPEGKPFQYIFSDSTEPLTLKEFKVRWVNFQKEAGITATPHQFRHAFASIMHEAGISPKDAQGILGHAQIATTMDIYTHFSNQRNKKAATILNKYTNSTQTG